MLELRRVNGPTGRLLEDMLRERGLLGGKIQGVVNYGYGGQTSLPTLNANAGRLDKYRELVKLDDAGVRTIPFSLRSSDLDIFPAILGRSFHHTQGRDIVIIPQEQIQTRLRQREPHDYYTGLVPKQNEFRVWVFRDKVLATYEKKLEYPAKYGRRGRSKEVWNWHNGFAFSFVRPETTPDRLKSIAIDAIGALELDFGAADVLLGADRRFYVLEVNTAPGTQGTARQGITSLVNCIERWAKSGCKRR